jgi:hypothetical protein
MAVSFTYYSSGDEIKLSAKNEIRRKRPGFFAINKNSFYVIIDIL